MSVSAHGFLLPLAAEASDIKRALNQFRDALCRMSKANKEGCPYVASVLAFHMNAQNVIPIALKIQAEVERFGTMAAARELGTSRAMVSYYTKINSLLEPCRKEIDPCFELNMLFTCDTRKAWLISAVKRSFRSLHLSDWTFLTMLLFSFR